WDAKVDRTRRVALATSRGVSTWLDVEARADRTCRRRIFVGTVDARLVALDAATGTPCAGFGRSGQVDLTEGIAVIDRCCYQVTSGDAERGLVFLPTSSPSPDCYGGERLGANVYANSVVALRATTGDVVWHFQVVHHDLWDYDVPAQPVLVNVTREGKPIPAVV